MKVTHLMSEAWERFKKISEGHFVWCAFFLQCSEIEGDCFEIFQSQSTNIGLQVLIMQCLLIEETKTLEGWLATLNASSAIMSHALEQINAGRIGVICQSPSSKLSASCLHCYSVSIQKIQGFFLEGDIRNTPDCPGRNNSHFALENEGLNMSLDFLVWHPPWFFSFVDMVCGVCSSRNVQK